MIPDFKQAEFSETDLHIQGDNFQKFAELIITKCAEIADIEKPNSIGCGYITKTKGMLIKEHFGILSLPGQIYQFSVNFRQPSSVAVKFSENKDDI